MLAASFQRGDPDLGRVEVHVARADAERFAHAASGECEGARERLHGGFRVGPDRGEESLALVGRQIFPAVLVDELAWWPTGHRALIAARRRLRILSSTTIPIESSSSARGSSAAARSGSGREHVRDVAFLRRVAEFAGEPVGPKAPGALMDLGRCQPPLAAPGADWLVLHGVDEDLDFPWGEALGWGCRETLPYT